MLSGNEIFPGTLLVISSITDLARGKIFNVITLPFLCLGIALAFASSLRNGGESLFAVTLAFCLLFPLYRIHVFAAGDVKLLMAYGAWSQPKEVLVLTILAVLIGAAVGGIVLARYAGLRGGLLSLATHATPGKARVSHRMPFAPAFFCAFLLTRIAEIYRWPLY